MPNNGFSVSRDLSVSISTTNGALQPTLVTGFESKQDTTEKKVKGIDGRVRNVVFPDGWSGGFDMERQNSIIDDYFAGWEADYFQGLDVGTGVITQSIAEPDGSQSQYQYTNVSFKYDNAGKWAGDDTVTQRLTWIAERRIKLS
jgi:hypothetical protein